MRRRARTLVAMGLLVAVVVAVNVWAAGSLAQIDLSEANRFSLTRESRAIAKAVDGPLRITAFLFEGGGTARDARFLLNRYREINRDIDYEIVDPDEQPGEARRFGVTEYSTVVLEYRGRRQDIPEIDEVKLSTAMLALLRGRTRAACVLQGHGEGDLESDRPTGLSKFGELLEQNGYEPRLLDLTRTGDVPGDCDIVVIAGARVPLLPEEEAAVAAWTAEAGRLMVLATPLSSYDPNPLLEPWGIAFSGGLVVDFSRSEGLDVSNLIVEEFPTASPVVEDVPRLQFPASGALGVQSNAEEGLTVATLAITSGDSFLETQPDVELSFSPGDIPGPIVVAAAADDSRVEPTGEERIPDDDEVPVRGPRIVRTRVVATGTAEWVGNEFLDQLGNRRLLVNALNWLSEEEEVLTVGAQVDTRRPLPWTPERQNRTLAVTVGMVPGGVVLAGLVQWIVTRRREQGPA